MKIRKINFDRRYRSTKEIGCIFKRVKRKVKQVLRISATIGFLVFLAYGVWFTNNWFEKHYLIFNKPVEVYFNPPIQVRGRKPEVKLIVIDKTPKLDQLTPIEKYICDKFGVYDCKMALAVARAESGMNAEAWNVNRNGTIDVGIFQINSIHFNQPGCSLKEVADAKGNVDCAYSIWQEQGWRPWTVAKNGRFIKFLKTN